MMLIVDTRNHSLLVRRNGCERPVRGWKKHRDVVRDYVTGNFKRPYPPRLELAADEARELLDTLQDDAGVTTADIML